ncbi:MAG TPA: hypothetical protein VH592_25150 [Gemmataceae bacterium]|jgi:hypothetical protein
MTEAEWLACTETEAEWLTCTDPLKMLRYLLGRTSDRKLRLFAVACCRRIWHLLIDKRSREAVEVAERYADGRATDEELETASDAAHAVWDADMERASTEGKWDRRSRLPYYNASAAAYNVAIPLGWWGAAPAFVDPDKIARETVPDTSAEGAAQCVLLRDIFGNPFRPVTLHSTWLVWQGGTIPNLGQAIYDDRAFDRLPILADALEEAGCTNADVLAHCRQPWEHVRGCWAVDLLLGKE